MLQRGAMSFSSESEVREWLRRSCRNAGAKVWWIENGKGGTFGFPDSVVEWRGSALFIELKVVEAGCIEAHPSQMNVVREMQEKGLNAAFLCGVKRVGVSPRKLKVLAPDDLVRASAHKKIGGRNRYKMASRGVGMTFDEFQVRDILDAIAGNYSSESP